MRYLLGVDNGGTFSKAAVFDEDGNQLSAASLPVEMLTPKPGYTERDMDTLWRANAQVIRDAILRSGIAPKQIAGVSFSGHGKGLYMVGYDGRPSYNGIISTDTRASECVKRWYADKTSQKIYEKTLQQILPSQHVSLLKWMKDNCPEALRKTKYIFAVKDYIRYKLTGEAFAEYSDFSGSNLINMHTGRYDVELLELFGIPEVYEKLPPLRFAADICGHVTREASELTLLPEGLPVVAGMFDVNACGIASGLADEKSMCMIAGTWSINEYLSKQPITNGTVDLNSLFCIPGYYLVEESSPTSAGNLEWFARNLMSYEAVEAKSEGKSVYAVADEWIGTLDPRDSNVIFLPFLNGSNEDPLAKGSFIGLTSYNNKKHMLLAVYEGVVFSHLTHVGKLLRNREAPKSIRLSGGAANSKVWVQIFADALQIPIDTVAGKELGAQGAAMAAGIAVGIYADYADAVRRTVKITDTVYPRPEMKPVYEKKYEAYRKINSALNGTWASLNRE